MSRKRCRAELGMDADLFVCDRRKGHDGRHRERMYGADGRGQFACAVWWRRVRDRRA